MASGPEKQGQRRVSRILIYGVTGSGKTTLARRMSGLTGLPWHSVNDLTWEPNWVVVPIDEQRRSIEEICAGEEWILDHAYGKWRKIPLDRAELIVALDYPRWLSLSRLIRRTLVRLVSRRTICNGNRETLQALFARDSIVLWHFQSFQRKRARKRAWSSNPAHRCTDSPRPGSWKTGFATHRCSRAEMAAITHSEPAGTDGPAWKATVQRSSSIRPFTPPPARSWNRHFPITSANLRPRRGKITKRSTARSVGCGRPEAGPPRRIVMQRCESFDLVGFSFWLLTRRQGGAEPPPSETA
jgi:adenylate kinase family enzyme